MMPHFANPTPDEQVRFLIRLYFGVGEDLLLLCVRRAYLDLSRTLHGIGASPGAFSKGSSFLRKELALLPKGHAVATETRFDAWHKRICTTLRELYLTEGYSSFRIGQAQKWVNMSLKYVYVVGEEHLPGFAVLYPFCHVPIDSVVLGRAEFRALRTFQGAWSRIDDYDEYLAFQQAVRTTFRDSAPLAVEFTLWQKNAA